MITDTKFKNFGHIAISEYEFEQDDPLLGGIHVLSRHIELNLAQEIADNAIEDLLRGVL